MRRDWLRPDWDPGLTLPHLPLEPLVGRGIRALLLDVDRTLLPGRDVELPAAVRQWVQSAQRHTHLHLISNNPSRQRIGAVSDQLGIGFTSSAAKPRRGAIRRVMETFDVQPQQIAMIGDRLFTDVLVGNRLGLYTVLVRPLRADGSPCPHDRVQSFERQVARWLGVGHA